MLSPGSEATGPLVADAVFVTFPVFSLCRSAAEAAEVLIAAVDPVFLSPLMSLSMSLRTSSGVVRTGLFLTGADFCVAVRSVVRAVRVLLWLSPVLPRAVDRADFVVRDWLAVFAAVFVAEDC